jgi:uncharacterized repeat protein (TIGR03847 family)
MPRITHQLGEPDRFVVGTVGRPGERTFFLQVRQGNRLVSMACEKEQVQILADHLSRLTEQVIRVTGETAAVEAVVDDEPLDLPLVEEFRVGTISIAWDGPARRIQLELFSVNLEENTAGDAVDDDEQGESVVVSLTLGMSRAFVTRALTIVKAGRPPCPLCGQPLSAAGHICPRRNGYRAL